MKKEIHSLSIHIALSQAKEGKAQRRTIMWAVREYVSLQTARAFTAKHVEEWIKVNVPSLVPKANTISMSLKRLEAAKEIFALQKTIRGRYGVYMRNRGKSYSDNSGSDGGEEQI